MSGSTTFAGIKYAEAADEVNKFPVNVSEPGAKTIDKYLEEHTLSYAARAASLEAKSGELIEATKAITVTLPSAATANRLIAVVNGTAAETVKITTSGGASITGAYLGLEGTIELAAAQNVLLFSNGVTLWFVLAGEPLRTRKWAAIKSFTKAEAEAGIEPSKNRPALVSFENATSLTIGGVEMLNSSGTYWINATQKWTANHEPVRAQTLLL